ncbi:molybdenum cofactor guanylyltransferase [Amnibacterium endophyticum]|uniref:Molybdenum cofactor guanylyltransferase n=1 Tax=Amnibacterium endophyticum TaxID=2109337 RepID=A0ABW4LET7_9MICO
MELGAVVLAGGRGSRMGGADKASLVADGATLLERALEALADVDVVVVGPPRPGVRTVREAPSFAGPAAAAVTGLAALPDAEDVLLLAIDVPGLPAAVPLLRAAEGGPDGVVAVDEGGRDQWLLGRYRAGALREAAAALGDPTGAPLRALLGRLRLGRLALPSALTADVDTLDDAEAAGVAPPVRREEHG